MNRLSNRPAAAAVIIGKLALPNADDVIAKEIIQISINN